MIFTELGKRTNISESQYHTTVQVGLEYPTMS